MEQFGRKFGCDIEWPKAPSEQQVASGPDMVGAIPKGSSF